MKCHSASGQLRARRHGGQIVAGNDGVDTRQGCGLVGIDMSDACVCVGAAQHLPDQQTRQGDIRAELRSSGDFIDGIDLRRLASKDPKRLRSSVHAVLPYNASCSLPCSVIRCPRLVYGHHLMALIIAQTMVCGCRSMWRLWPESSPRDTAHGMMRAMISNGLEEGCITNQKLVILKCLIENALSLPHKVVLTVVHAHRYGPYLTSQSARLSAAAARIAHRVRSRNSHLLLRYVLPRKNRRALPSE